VVVSVDAGSPPEAGPDAIAVPSCGLGNGGCDPAATCISLGGAVSCQCNDGYGGDGTTCSAGQALVAVTASASSTTTPWSASNAQSPDAAGWMSAVGSGNVEWLEYDLGAPTYITEIELYVAASGSDEVLQASADGGTWTTIHTIDWSLFRYDDPSAPAGDESYTDYVQTSQPYQYVRIYSQPASFLYYSWMQISGVQ
jgi:hypothetical protein